jgi:hypothetical protein
MIVRKFLFFKSVQCFVKKDKTFLKFLGHFVLFVKKIWDGLSIPKGYFVLGTFCPKDRSVTGTLHPRMFRPGTFRQGTSSSHQVYLLLYINAQFINISTMLMKNVNYKYQCISIMLLRIRLYN